MSKHSLLLLIVLPQLSIACGDEPESNLGCVDGTTQLCNGAGQCDGVQVCSDDSWSACDCGPAETDDGESSAPETTPAAMEGSATMLAQMGAGAMMQMSSGESADACEACTATALDGACGAAFDACAASSVCLSLAACATSCTTDACVRTCAQTFPSGVPTFVTLLECLTAQCTSSCGAAN